MTQIACSLTTPDAARQIVQWHDLGRQATAVEHFDGGFAVTFPIETEDSVERLAAAEARCCGFLTIETHRTAGSIRLEIRADGDARPVVEALAVAIAP